MKLNKEKFMKTEMGGELEETIRTWDKALDERRKATPGIGNPDQGLGFKYWDNTCRSCQDRWEVFKLAIKQFYGIRVDRKDGKGSRSDDRSHYRRRRCTWIRRGVQEAEREPEQIQKSDGDAGPERKTEDRKMKKIDFRQRAAKTEERKRKSKYADVMVRATVMGLMKPDEDVDRMMDIESADKKFNMHLDEWLNADDFNFAHDFYGIVNNINREKGFPATDFGFFVPRFAGR